MDALSATGRVLCRHRHSCDGEPFSAPQHRPGDPGELVGEGHDRDVAMGAVHEPFGPSSERSVALSYIGQRRARSMNQLLAQVFVAALADPEQLRLATGRELTRNQAEPRGEIAPAVEAFRPTHGGDQGGRDYRAATWDCRQPASLFVLLHPADQRMARPVCKGVCRDWLLIQSASTYPASRSPSGHDGDTHAPVLIKLPASDRAVF